MKYKPWLIRVACLFFVLALLLLGCKISRKGTASKSPAVNTSSGYPASEYYGDTWNTEHIRTNNDSKSTGKLSLNLTPAGTSGFVMPVCGKALSEFGARSGRTHTGIDLKLEKESPVHCAFDGMVRLAKVYGNYGKTVVVRHDNGMETVYSHLNSIAVKQNQRMKAGDRIGGGGKTGNASTEHLHFEIRFKGEPFNPRLVIDVEKCRLKTNVLTINNNSFK